MIKVFLDASVIIAALLSPGGGSAKIVEFGNAGIVHAITSQTVLDEIADNLNKIKRSERQLNSFISNNSILVRERITLSEIQPFLDTVEPKDAHVLAGAFSTKCACIATLDKKHLLQPQVRRYLKPIKIQTPGEILEELVN